MASSREETIEKLIEQMVEATKRAESAIDETIAFVEASNRRIAAMEERAAHYRQMVWERIQGRRF